MHPQDPRDGVPADKPPSDAAPQAPAVDAFAQVAALISAAFQRAAAALRPLIDFADSPQGKAMIAAHRRRVRLGLNDTEACHCLCQLRHPGHEVCQGEVLRRTLLPVQIGVVAVSMCPRCVAAQPAGQAAR